MRGATGFTFLVMGYRGNFNPHSPCGERRSVTKSFPLPGLFQSTLPMRGATQGTHHAQSVRPISIHTPHAGSDSPTCRWPGRRSYFNPHSPCGERPTRRLYVISSLHFNPHSPCGERRFSHLPITKYVLISIHTPHAGSDFSSLIAR